MSLLQSGGILEDPPQPPVGRRGLTAQQVQDAITARLASYDTQARVAALLAEKVDESDYNIRVAGLDSRDTENRNNIAAAVARLATAEGEIDTLEAGKVSVDDFYMDITPRYCTLDRLSGNFVFVFSHVPAKYATANLVQVNFQGVSAYRGAWTPSTEYILFGLLPTAVQNIRNNTARNQSVWRGAVSFFAGTTNLGEEMFIVAIDRG